MALGRAYAVALWGVEGQVVEVEADVGRGLPGMYIGGLGDVAVTEARERVRSAVQNSGLNWPKSKVVVGLSPASLRKRGTAFDLAIACSVLIAVSNAAIDTNAAVESECQTRLKNTVLIGELGLDGSVREVEGVLPAVLAAKRIGCKQVVVPEGNGAEATLVPGIAVYIAPSLAQLWTWVETGQGLRRAETVEAASEPTQKDMADVQGQEDARFAMEVAAAGGHHVFMLGSPGTGKSMLAERLPTILPPLTHSQKLEVTAIHSIVGRLQLNGKVRTCIQTAPFVSPHHSTTTAALLGGGNSPTPGALSLAHRGVLFLDEVSLMRAQVLDALRIPLETGEVTLMRAKHSVRFPCRTQLIMAANPCSCGAVYARDCTCSAADRAKHLKALSGPLKDRIDISCTLAPHMAVMNTATAENSNSIRQRVVEARARATRRWQKLGLTEANKTLCNAEVPGAFIRREATADDESMALLQWKLTEGEITQRGVDKILRIAWTLADLAQRDRPSFEDINDACALHAEEQ